MALQLKKVKTRVFSGQAESDVLLECKAADDVPATILATYYNGVAQDKPPFTIKVAAENNPLVVVFASIEGSRVSILEVDSDDSGNTQVLAQSVFHKSSPNVTILIRNLK